MKTPKPTKTQAEITKLEKKILKLTSDLEARRKLEQLRAKAAELEAQLEAKPEEPCKRPHFDQCPLPHSPWWASNPWFQPWQHGWDCKCSSCRPTQPVWIGSPVITCGDISGNVTTTPNTGSPYTIYGGKLNNGPDNSGIGTFSTNSASVNTNLMMSGTRIGPDGVPFTFTSEN